MGGSRIQICLLIEPNSQSAVDHTSSSGGSSVVGRRYALLPSRTKNHVFRKTLAKNGIEVLKSVHANSLQYVKLEILEVFVDSGRKAQLKPQYVYVDYENLNVVKQLFSESSEICFSYKSSTAVRYVLDEEENLQVIEKMLVTGAEITVRCSNGETLLHFAADSNHFYEKLMKLVLKYGANINARKWDDGATPLHLAVRKNCLGSAMLLLEHGALIDCKMKDGLTPLHVAVRENRLKIAWLLLDNGANANARMKNGSTPHYEAVKAGLSEMVKLLAEQGAHAEAHMKIFLTSLYKGVKAGSLEVVRRLMQSGEDVNAETKDRATALHIAVQRNAKDNSIVVYLVRNGADVNSLDVNGATPLHYCGNDKLTLMQLLVDHGADINVETNNGVTVLLKAILKGDLTACEYLLDRNPNFRVGGNRLAFKLALGRADRPEYLEIMDRMVQQGFSVDAKEANNPEVLFETISKNRPEIVEQLLILGANVNQHSKFRKHNVTPLHLAIQGNHEDIVRRLLNHGANVRVKCDPNDCKSTPMSYAVTFASLNIIKMLVAKNVKVQEVGCPLHLAAKNSDSEVIQFLLEESNDLNDKNEKGETPMSIAVREGNIKAIEVMVRFGAQVSLLDISGRMKYDCTLLKAFLDYCFKHIILSADTVFKLFGLTFHCRPYSPDDCVTVFVRHLIKMEMANNLACARDLVPSYIYEHVNSFDDFKKQCELETNVMALEKVGHTDVTFYDVLVKNRAQIAGFARNQNFVETFVECNVKSKFLIYGSILDTKFRLGNLRRNLLKRGIKVLSIYSWLFFVLPDDLKEIIVDYLSNQDLFILQKGLPEE